MDLTTLYMMIELKTKKMTNVDEEKLVDDPMGMVQDQESQYSSYDYNTENLRRMTVEMLLIVTMKNWRKWVKENLQY